MYRKDDRSDMLEQMDLSFFSLAKIIELSKKVTKKRFKEILSPWDDPDSLVLQVMDMRETFVYFLKGYTPWLPTIPLHQGMRWDPTWKTLPTFEVTRSVWKRMGLKKERILNIRSSFDALRNKGLNERQRKSFLSFLFSGEQFSILNGVDCFFPSFLVLCLCRYL